MAGEPILLRPVDDSDIGPIAKLDKVGGEITESLVTTPSQWQNVLDHRYMHRGETWGMGLRTICASICPPHSLPVNASLSQPLDTGTRELPG